MYITKAINTAKTLRPDEYTIEEYIAWCNELSCDLYLNHQKEFEKIKVHNSNQITLPENVDIYMIEKIIADGKELKKTDLYDFSNMYLYQKRGRNVFKAPSSVSDIEIIYQKPYIPIRTIDETVTVKTTPDTFETEDIGIYEGDTLVFSSGDDRYEIHVISNEGNVYNYSGDTLPDGISEYNIKRKILEKTVCPPPFDYMYVDFLIAKSALYSGDSNAYKNHMAAFSLKQAEYANWVARRRGLREKKLINWF